MSAYHLAYRDGYRDGKREADQARGPVRAYVHEPCGSLATPEFREAGGGCWNCQTRPDDEWTPLHDSFASSAGTGPADLDARSTASPSGVSDGPQGGDHG